MNQIKLKKIGSEIVREVSDILENKCRDRLMHTFTITGCEVTNDLSFAKVYFTCFDEDRKKVLKELQESAGFLRHEIATRVDIRHTPELTFVYDESLEYAKKIEDKIKEINTKK